MFAFIVPLGGEGNLPSHELPGQRPGRPERPDNSLPPIPALPDNGLPEGGSTIEIPTNPIVLPPHPSVNPPPAPVFPGVPIYPAPPSINPPLQPGQVYPPLPPILGSSGQVLALVFISGIGARWTVLDLTNVATPK